LNGTAARSARSGARLVSLSGKINLRGTRQRARADRIVDNDATAAPCCSDAKGSQQTYVAPSDTGVGRLAVYGPVEIRLEKAGRSRGGYSLHISVPI